MKQNRRPLRRKIALKEILERPQPFIPSYIKQVFVWLPTRPETNSVNFKLFAFFENWFFFQNILPWLLTCSPPFFLGGLFPIIPFWFFVPSQTTSFSLPCVQVNYQNKSYFFI